MPSFGARSIQQLNTVHPDGQIIMYEVIKIIDCAILEGHRSTELQREYFERHLSKNPPGTGLHELTPSMAWHAMPWFQTEPHIDWKHLPSMYYLAGIIIGTAQMLRSQGKIEHSVRWGGDWDRDSDVRENQWNDLAHYELREE